jgi:signal transduction histidine kinase
LQTRPFAALSRRPTVLVLTFTAAVLVFVVAIQAIHLTVARRRTLDSARQRAGNAALVLSEYVRGSFGLADQALRQLTVHARRIGGPRSTGEAWDPILAAAKAALPGGGSLTVTDAAGTIVHSTQPAIIGASRRDNYVFRQLAALDHDALVVDRPFLTVVAPPQFIIPIGRRLTRADGSFDGTVVAVLLPERYREFFRTVDVGHGGLTWVLHPDGVVLFREPSDTNPINEAARDHPILQAARTAPNGIIERPLQPGGPLFITAYRTIDSPPLVVGVSLERSEVLADWNHQVRSSAVALSALALTVGFMVVIVFREMQARSRAEQELTTLQRLESDRLREANERLEDALQKEQRARRETEIANYEKDEFLMTVSHELRTPLTAIAGWVGMLAGREMTREQQARALEAIERNAAAQARLIEDLLDVSRAISGRLRIEARLVDLRAVIRAAIDTLQPALAAKSLAFTSRIADIEPFLADPDRLQQIVWNLLSNAIKFTPERGTVELEAAPSGGHLEIVVRDSGSGIPAEFLPHIFERFRQADAGARRRYGGLGLGLAIVRYLVEAHGGAVNAESEGEGRGSTFRVRLPIRRTAPTGEPGAAARPSVHDVG